MAFKGKVKSFNASRGFGFISDKTGDIFLLEKYCVDGKQPKKGDTVFFDKEPGIGKSCKFEARNVTGGSGEPIKLPAEEQPMPAEEQQQQEQDVKAMSSVTGGYASTSIAPVAMTVAPSESSPNSVEATVDQVDVTTDTLADTKKIVVAGDFDSFHDAYKGLGSEDYYKTHGEEYTNPHEAMIARALVTALDKWAPQLVLPLRRVHDLACGSGEASAAISKLSSFAGCALDASDPYTFAAFEKRMGQPAYRWSFEDIANDVLEDVQPYDLVIASFSLHLLKTSWKHATLAALARSCRTLIVLTPTKLPVIEPSTGWRQVDEVLQDRVRVRLYISDSARRLEPGEAIEHNDYTIICKPPLLEEQAPNDDELEAKELDDIKDQISNMTNLELREALIKRGLSTAGQRRLWGDRLFEALKQAKDAKEPEGGHIPHADESQENKGEAEKSEDESDPEVEESSEYESESDEDVASDEEDESDPSESTRDDNDEAAQAAKRAAIKAILAAKKPTKRTGKQTAAAKTAAAQTNKESKKKAGDEWTSLKAETIAAAHVQGNFGQTKFIKP